VAMNEFTALVLDEVEGKVTASIQQLEESQLPEGDVTVRVHLSNLNYKDGLILKGLGRLVRKYPHIPGVDFAGVVERSSNADFKPGDGVILTGWRVGEIHWGGYSQLARVKGEWLVKRPSGLTLTQAMSVGTAGFEAMLAVDTLERYGLRPEQGEVLVTGASGGVGSVAVAILARLGYKVAALTGRASEHEYLRKLGATTIVDRAEMAEAPKKPMLSERWAAVVDAVGGDVLANAIAQTRYGGGVAACGNAGGNTLTTSVLPFLLRGVNLLGIDSVMAPKARRIEIWDRLSRDLPLEKLNEMMNRVGLREVPEAAEKILAGKVRGRTVVYVNGQ